MRTRARALFPSWEGSGVGWFMVEGERVEGSSTHASSNRLHSLKRSPSPLIPLPLGEGDIQHSAFNAEADGGLHVGVLWVFYPHD
jgi:hypothetical protein